jgi:beta-phosphoglucomutase-like phosphatase (HAD superfamily)
MSMGSNAPTGFVIFLNHEVSRFPKEARTTNHPPTRGVDLETLRVAAYQGSVKLIQQLRHQGFKLAVVTSGQNCAAILKAVKPDALFEVRIDGGMIPSQHLAGKPAPIHF